MPSSVDEIRFGGLAAHDADERIPFESALECMNAVLDEGTIKRREGSRSATNEALGSAGDNAQGLWRFRTSLSSARVVAARGGNIDLLTDPTSEETSDSTVSNLGGPFANTARLNAAPLGTNLYLSTDEASTPWRRVNSSYALESLEAISQGGVPSGSTSTPAWVTYRGLTMTDSGLSHANDGGSSTWVIATVVALGDSLQVTLASALNFSLNDWLLVGVAPWDASDGSATVDVHIAEDNSGSPGTYIKIGSTKDVPPFPGAPNLLYCDLRGIPAASRDAIKYIKFVAAGTSIQNFAIYGHLQIPSAPVNNPEQYVVTFYNSSTLVESAQSAELKVGISGGNLPAYDDRYYASSTFRGTGTANPIGEGNRRIYNRESGTAMPQVSEIGQLVTVTGTAPTFSSPSSLTVRLWKLTPTGYRLVTTGTVTSGGAYTLYDYGGSGVLANQKLKPGGKPPRANVLFSHAGRLVAGYEQRIYISSFTPTSDTTNPVSQFPDIAVELADGWSFDLSTGKDEYITAGVSGDVAYLLTNKACYSLADLSAPLYGPPPFQKIFQRGSLSRYALYVEDSLIFPAYDGVYVIRNRSDVQELTGIVRRIYTDWLDPDCYVCLAYSNRILHVYQGAREMRYDFRKSQWTRHTHPYVIRHAASWLDV